MLRLRPPKQPKGFSKEVAAARRAVKSAIAAGQKLDAIPELWRDEKYKRAFSNAQHGKCGYCETFALNHPAAMEHFAPKGEVEVLLDEGVEADGLHHVRDRRTLAASSTGYHWLAFDWSNWLLACERCNTGWKRSLFPVREDLTPAFVQALEAAHRLGGIEGAKAFLVANPLPAPSRRRKVTPLLLNPFGPEDAVDHLAFSEIGQIAPRNGSEHGRQTIRTCGLHRESLRRARQGIAADTVRHTARLTRALAGDDFEKAHGAVQDLLSLGAEDRAHAGMVRCIVLSELALRWPDLKALEKKLKPAAAPTAGRRNRS